MPDNDSRPISAEMVDQLTGRMLTLEVLAVVSLGLYLANSRNDPNLDHSRGVMEYLRNLLRAKAGELTDSQQAAALDYGDELLSQVLENLRALRGKG